MKKFFFLKLKKNFEKKLKKIFEKKLINFWKTFEIFGSRNEKWEQLDEAVSFQR